MNAGAIDAWTGMYWSINAVAARITCKGEQLGEGKFLALRIKYLTFAAAFYCLGALILRTPDRRVALDATSIVADNIF